MTYVVILIDKLGKDYKRSLAIFFLESKIKLHVHWGGGFLTKVTQFTITKSLFAVLLFHHILTNSCVLHKICWGSILLHIMKTKFPEIDTNLLAPTIYVKVS